MFNHVFGQYPLVPRTRVSYAVSTAFDGKPFGWTQHRRLFKGNVFQEIINNPVTIVTEPFKALDREVLQPLYREVIQPVGHALEKVGQGIAKDPVTFLAQVAAIAAAPFTAGQSLWALPVIAAASTAAHGGSLEQVLTNTAISAASVWAGGQVGGWLMDGMSVATDIGPSFAIAGQEISFSTAQMIAQVGTGTTLAAIQATGAAVQGKDPLAAAIPALAGTAAGVAVGQLAQTEIFQDVGAAINSVGANVSPVVQKALTGVTSAAITGAMMGKDMTGSAVGAVAGGIMEGLYSTVNFVGDLFKTDGQLTKTGAATQGLITNLVATVAANAAQSGPIGNQFNSKLMNSISGTLGTYITAGYDALATQVQDLYYGASSTATRMNTAAQSQTDIANKYNSGVAEYQAKSADLDKLYAQQDDLIAKYNAATTQAEVNSLKTQIDGVQSNITTHISDLNAMNQEFLTMQKQYDAAVNETTAAQTQYYDLVKELGSKADILTSKTNEIAKAMNQDLVKTIDPSFNEQEYLKINNLGGGVDAYSHFMSVGKDQGLPTNLSAASAEIANAKSSLVDKILAAQGWAPGINVPASVRQNALDMVNSQYGINLEQLKGATVENITSSAAYGIGKSLDSFAPKFDSEAAKSAVLDQAIKQSMAPGWYKPDTSMYSMPNGMKFATQQQIAEMMANDKSAVGIYTDTDKNGYTVYLTQDQSYKPVQKYNASTGEIEPSASVLTDMIRMQDMSATDKVKFLAKMDAQTTKYLNDQLKSDAASQGASFANKAIEFINSNVGDSAKNTVLSLLSSVGSTASMPGSFMETFGSLTNTLTNIGTYIDATSIKDAGIQLQSWGNAVQTAANAAKSEDSKKAVEDWSASMKAASGVLDSVQNFASQLKTNGAEFMSGFVTKEIGEELLQQSFAVGGAVVGGGAGFLLGGPAGAAAGAVTGYRAISAVGSFFENYQGGNDEVKARTYDALIAKGYSKSDADTISRVMGGISGFTQGAISGGIDWVMTSSVPNTILSQITGGETALGKVLALPIKSAIGNMVSGLPEGGLQAATTESMVYMVDPSKANFASGITQGALWESLIGGPTAFAVTSTVGAGAAAVSAMPTASDLMKLAIMGNTEFSQQLYNAKGSLQSMGEVLKSWIPSVSATTPEGYSIDLRASILPTVLEQYPVNADQYGTPQQFMDAISAATGVSYAPTLAQVANNTTKFAGSVTTLDEAKKILESQGLVGITDQDALAAGIIGQTKQNEAQLAQQYADSNMVGLEEIQAAAKQENYSATAEELNALVGRGVEASVVAKFISDIDPKAVTQAEATQYFLDQGYDKARAEDIAQFVKSAPEETVKQSVAEWVNPRQVTRAEAVKFFTDLGYTPTEQEITQYVVQGPEVFQDAIKTQLGEYVDPRMVDASEVQAAFKNMGLNAPVAASDVLRLSGQYAETELAKKAEEALPIVSANSVYALLTGDTVAGNQLTDQILTKIEEYKNLGLSQADAQTAATKAVAAQIGTTETNLLGALGATQDNLITKIDEYKSGTEQKLVDISSGIATTKSAILDQMAAYQKANMDADMALDLAISGVAQNLGVAKADLLTQMGTTEAALKNELAQQSAQLTGQIQTVQQQVGRPSQQATAADATTIQGIIAGTTPVNLAYDTNNDGKVDQTDLTNVQNQLTFQQNQNIQQKTDTNTGLTYYIDTTTGQEVTPPTALGGQWAPTGVYAALMQQEARQAETAKAAAAQARTAQQKNQFGQLVNMLFSAPDAAGQQVTVKTPDPSRIGYIYDWSSIFATPSQASMMPSPYGAMNTVAPQQQQKQSQPFSFGFAEGGIVGGNDINVGDGGSVDDLINLLKGNSG